jgi:hypothetical protein
MKIFMSLQSDTHSHLTSVTFITINHPCKYNVTWLQVTMVWMFVYPPKFMRKLNPQCKSIN